MQYGGGLNPQQMQRLGLSQGYRFVSPSYGWAWNGNMLDGAARMQQMPSSMQNVPVSNPGNFVDWNTVNATTTRQMNEANARQQALAKNGSRGDVRQQAPPARQPAQFDAATYEAQAANNVQFERNRQAMLEQQAKPSDLNQWKRIQNQWAKEPAAPQLPLWTPQQMQAAGVMMPQQMTYDQAAAQFRAASEALTGTINPTVQQHVALQDAYDQAKLNLSHTQSPQQEQMIAEGKRNFSNRQNQAAAQQAFYQQGPMTAQRVQAINADPFYAQRFQQQAMWNAPQIRYGGGPSMGYVDPRDQAMLNRTTW